jgi:hypothetical protein
MLKNKILRVTTDGKTEQAVDNSSKHERWL